MILGNKRGNTRESHYILNKNQENKRIEHTLPTQSHPHPTSHFPYPQTSNLTNSTYLSSHSQLYRKRKEETKQDLVIQVWHSTEVNVRKVARLYLTWAMSRRWYVTSLIFCRCALLWRGVVNWAGASAEHTASELWTAWGCWWCGNCGTRWE